MASNRNIFDLGVEAELFLARSNKRTRSAVTYSRFSHAAAAIRFAVEKLPAELLRGAVIEINGERYSGEEIRSLYNGDNFPRSRDTEVLLP